MDDTDGVATTDKPFTQRERGKGLRIVLCKTPPLKTFNVDGGPFTHIRFMNGLKQ